MRKLKKYFESPRDRRVRKNYEYKMALIRTVGAWVSAIATLVGVMINALVFMKVWFK